MVIDGKEVRTGNLIEIVPPTTTVTCWDIITREISPMYKWPWSGPQSQAGLGGHAMGKRAAIFLKAAELIAGPYRSEFNAVT